MFCPKCAAQNVDGASFCRVCGANISLIPHALSGQLQQAPPDETACGPLSRSRRGRRELNIENAFKNVFMGIAFLIVALALAFSRMGTGWWFWLLIPAFSMMGTGVAQYVRLRERQRQSVLNQVPPQPTFQPAQPVNTFPTRPTGELVSPPPSVTEGTTRHLGAEAPTQHFKE